ncbi:arylamine N-acetyltransferase family protein [Legionella sp. D16C41]|uniref:arylamine N-acetyltransferase family protein n=1 Tax=Legionella sp. D16C41 TaxID=3402688 RepID=UPI003AF4A64E
MINLERYLKKINITAKPLKNLSSTEQFNFLSEIYFSHLKCFPYENFELRAIAKQHLLQRKSLNFFSYDKLLLANQGGYCFQSAQLLADALTQLGFTVRPCAARVLNGAPVNDSNVLKLPATHMCLVATIAHEEFLLDPGLGSSAPRQPILIKDSQEVINQYPDQLKLYKEENLFILAKKTDKWTTLIQSDLQAADEKHLKANLLGLERYPDILPIRDEKTLVGLITNEGRKSLLWNVTTNKFEFAKQCGEHYTKEIIPDYKEAYKKLVEEFNISYISVEALQNYCTDTRPLKMHRRWEINLPVDKTEIANLEKNLSFTV